MALPELSMEQIENLRRYAEEFKEWLKTPEGKADVKEHRDHEKYLKEKLSPQNLEKMTSDEFREVYKALWASNMWGNKDWYVDNKLLKPNGFETIKRELKKLLYGPGEIDAKYDEFRRKVKGFGPSSISEILHFISPEKYCLWNEKPKSILPFLGLTLLPDRFFKYQIKRGSEYLQCINVLKAIKNTLRDYGIIDFIDLDVFFWYIYSNVMAKGKAEGEAKAVPVEARGGRPSHDELVDIICGLGELLDFHVRREEPTPDGVYRCDVTWRDYESHLPLKVFEVELSGNVDHALSSLAHAYDTWRSEQLYLIVEDEGDSGRARKLLEPRTKGAFARISRRLRIVGWGDICEIYKDLKMREELVKELAKR